MDRSIASASFLFLSYLIAWVLFSHSEKVLVAALPYFMKALKTEEVVPQADLIVIKQFIMFQKVVKSRLL